ncbi:hypothetical protein SAMN04487934_101433 [Eubacterium ruminantium]|nr:hypothetical protein SAMN04487934_101433 [Eubacterium ruminantium]
MKLVFEMIINFIVDAAIETDKKSERSKPVRYLLFILFFLCFASIFGIVTYMGISIMEKQFIVGLAIAVLGAAMGLISIIGSIVEFRRRKKQENKDDL